MAILHAALCIFQNLLGIGSQKGESRNATDWLKLALAVAAQPEDDDSKRIMNTALESNNQVFLDFLRAALATRINAAARLADIESDGIECRAFLPGSPALWGWTTNLAAESVILQTGIDAAMLSSVFDSPSSSCSNAREDVFVGLNSSESMGGATLRDIYAKAWEFHREPLIWTPRGPGAGVGASTWSLTPASLTSQGARTRNRSVSDASESRSSVAGYSPCLYPQQNCVRRDSLHDVFTILDNKPKVPATQCLEPGMITPSPSLSTTPLPSVSLEPAVFRRPRRSTSCTRSHISSTTAVTVSECSTTQELYGFGLGLSFGRSAWSRPTTPSESCFGDGEFGKDEVHKRKRKPSRLSGGLSPVPSGVPSPRNEISGHSTFSDKAKQKDVCRPGIAPLQQRIQSPVSKRATGPQHALRTASASKVPEDVIARNSHLSKIVAGAQSKAVMQVQERSGLRRAQSVATMHLSPSPQVMRGTSSKTPAIGPAPAARRVSLKHGWDENSKPAGDLLHESAGVTRRSLQRASQPVSAPTIPRPPTTTCRMPGTLQLHTPRPVSRASSVRARTPSIPSRSNTPVREPHQLSTPISAVRTKAHSNSSRTSRPVLSDSASRTPSRVGQTKQERPTIPRESRVSRPPSRTHLTTGSSTMTRNRSTKRSSSATSGSALVGQQETSGVLVAA